MNGVHDMGGMHGFGPVEREENEPAFHDDWEPIIVGCVMAGVWTGSWNVDDFRAERERTDPATYLGVSYYELFVGSLERLLIEKGIASEDELERRRAIFRENPEASAADAFAGEAETALAAGKPWDFRRPLNTEPRFRPGDPVRTLHSQPHGHTRLARYARDKRGTVHAYHGGHVFPDSNSRNGDEAPGHLYSVRFESAEIWGEDAGRGEAIYLDLWQDYLLPA